MYFNPRLREGGDAEEGQVQAYTQISIHASAKEATLLFVRTLQPHKISIHASAKEATVIISNYAVALTFQSTPPRRRRLQIPGAHIAFVDFNPRLREGGDFTACTPIFSQEYFNPRLREGGDIKKQHYASDRLDFNPRLREGGDRNIL